MEPDEEFDLQVRILNEDYDVQLSKKQTDKFRRLFGIKHTFRVVQITVGAQADQTVVCFGILLFHKMAVVRTDQLHVIFTGLFY